MADEPLVTGPYQEDNFTKARGTACPRYCPGSTIQFGEYRQLWTYANPAIGDPYCVQLQDGLAETAVILSVTHTRLNMTARGNRCEDAARRKMLNREHQNCPGVVLHSGTRLVETTFNLLASLLSYGIILMRVVERA
ncbi:uncharacterized protein N7498_006351 [Penicillium cinerascens]|uniref:Uncharacterized protein n=1 Tax=Penicillium cinerascens TaxID=70096 RepID=A0A9W9MI32_9EURO|nr:uncharacterized protein N7498_006351 [Penicillium cinerascens]KAJ5201688.1 hypothetical protein N7498_006351 [Penicillium cinerascens]